MVDDLSRRGLVGLALGLPTLTLLGGKAPGQTAPALCVNLDTLPMSQKGMRRAINFKLLSPDPRRTCAACTFFTGTPGGCGKCQMLSGGAVAASSVCDSFAKKG